MTAFYYKDNVYIDRDSAEKIGRGGFGEVYIGDWHGVEAVFKFTKMQVENRHGKNLDELTIVQDVTDDLEKRLVEINKVPVNSNILKPLGHFRQQEQSREQSTGKFVAHNFEVIVSKRCRMDLEQFRTDEYLKLNDVNCQILLFCLKECLKSLEALVEANVSHNDIKPSNFLADWPEGEIPTISNLRIYLTDFGMVDRMGGTPVFCSPDIMSEAKPGVSDIYSMGRLFLFLVVESLEMFYCLVFISVTDASLCQAARKVIEAFPIINLIKKMTHIDQYERISINDVSKELCSDQLQLQVLTRHMIFSMFTEIGLEDVVDEIKLSLSFPEEQVSIMLRERYITNQS